MSTEGEVTDEDRAEAREVIFDYFVKVADLIDGATDKAAEINRNFDEGLAERMIRDIKADCLDQIDKLILEMVSSDVNHKG